MTGTPFLIEKPAHKSPCQSLFITRHRKVLKLTRKDGENTLFQYEIGVIFTLFQHKNMSIFTLFQHINH